LVDDSPLIGLSSALNLFSHTASFHTSTNAWYWLCVVDRAIVFCCPLARLLGVGWHNTSLLGLLNRWCLGVLRLQDAKGLQLLIGKEL
jgi:hypothetical protein